MRMVTGTTSPSTRYERISVSPASCSIKSEYVIASHAFKPQYKCINYIPAWEQRKLVDIAEIVGGGTPDTNNSNYWDGDIDWYAPAELGNNIYAESSTRKITQAGFDSCSTKMLPADKTILFTSRAGIGNTAILRHSACTNQGFQSLVIGDADVYFVYSMSERIKKWAEEKASGSTFLEISGRQLETMPVNLPSLVEQQAIGSFFSHLDDLITLHQRKYDKLVIFKKTMLEKMFPKDGESVPEIRFAGFTDPWEQRKFVDFVEASGIRNKDNLQLESYSVSNDRGFVPQDEQFENGGTMRDADKTAYWIVEPGSFAYNPARINVGSIGYQSTRKNVIVSSLYEVFKTDHSCDDRFLWHWFKSSLFTKQIEMLQEGGVRLYFFFDKLQKSEIWMPNVDEQRIIGQQFDQLDSLITLHQRKLELLRNIKKSLLDKMFV